MTTTDFGTKLPGLKCPRWPLCGDPHNGCVLKFPSFSPMKMIVMTVLSYSVIVNIQEGLAIVDPTACTL